ncbi:MAG TPA: hypothetical protein VMW79_06055 [Anaerolineae bacterium]|nr:hypothetical protein [Anaerolineae bacterium]HUW96003.1 hypothetical protein [Anaerolineae bacterium]
MSNEIEALVLQVEALRLEIRCAFSCLIAAIGAAQGGGAIDPDQFEVVEALHREADLLSEKAQRISRGEWSLGGKDEKATIPAA